MENEKFANIRQIIRKVLLPLIQTIYLEQPIDVNLFCAQYFSDALKRSQASQSLVENEKREGKDNAEQQRTADVLGSPAQGSTSLPILSSKEPSNDLSLRETISWNEPPRSAQLDRKQPSPIYSLADISSNIGDQATSEDGYSENTPFEVKMGDMNVNNKEDDVYLNPTEKKEMVRSENCLGTDHKGTVTSVPPHEESTNLTNDTSTNSKCGKPKNEVTDDHLKSLVFIENIIRSGEEDSRDLSQDTSNCENDTVKKCEGQLSPNSSFGFVPELKDHEETQTTAENSFVTDKNIYGIEKLTTDLSEAFYDLAKEFESAESNLNSEFLKAIEISDVIHNKKQLDNDEGIQIEKKIDGENDPQEAIKIVKEIEFSKESIEEREKVAIESNCKNEVKVSGESFDSEHVKPIEIFEVSTDIVNENELTTLSTGEIEHTELTKNLSKYENEYKSTGANIVQEDRLKNDPKLSTSNIDVSNEVPKLEAKNNVEETWRKKWYEVHPYLDDIRSAFRHHVSNPTFWQRSQLTNVNSHRSQPKHNIGEAGDVPLEQFDAANIVTNEMLESFSESDLEVNTTTPNTVDQNVNLQGSLSADEIFQRVKPGRMACNFFNRLDETSDTSTTNITKSTDQRNSEKYIGEEGAYDPDFRIFNSTANSNINFETSYEENRNVDLLEKSEGNNGVSTVDMEICDVDPVENACDDSIIGKDVKNDAGKEDDAVYNEDSVTSVNGNKDSFNDNEGNTHVKRIPSFPEAREMKFTSDTENGDEMKKQISEAIIVQDTENEKNNFNDENFAKKEPGLNSACGDFVASNDGIANGGEDINPVSSRSMPDNLPEAEISTNGISSSGIEEESFEVLGDVIETVKSDQKEEDAFDVLELLNYADSDSSNIDSSDISEEEDCSAFGKKNKII